MTNGFFSWENPISLYDNMLKRMCLSPMGYLQGDSPMRLLHNIVPIDNSVPTLPKGGLR